MEKKLIFIFIVSLLAFEAAGKKSQSKLQSHLSTGKFQSSQDKSNSHDAVLADIKPLHSKLNHNARVHNNDKSHQTPLQNDQQDPAIIDPVFDIQMQQTAPFPSGNYTIKSVASGLCLDVAGGGDNAGTNVDIEICTQTSNQIWYLKLDSGNVYFLQPQTGGTTCLDVDGSNPTPGTNVFQWPCAYSANEQWEIVPTGNNSYYLIAVFSRECLDVAGGATNPGTNVDEYNCTGQTNQQWIISPGACPSGSFWVPEVASCQSCNIKNCDTCEDNQGTVWCTSCLSGYNIEEGTGICVHSVAGWQNCGTGMFWNQAISECQSCSTVHNCLDCVNGGGGKPFCTICSTGYVASATNGTCNVALG